MAKFTCTVDIEADSATEVETILDKVQGVTSVYSIEEDEEELPEDDDEDVD